MPKLLITGGTGALGRAYLAYGDWRGRKIVLARDEHKMEVLRDLGLPEVRFILGDIRDSEKLRMAFRGVDAVLHLAALKRIPSGGYNADEVIHTNAIGSLNVMREAIHAGVKKVLCVTTDKGVEPINLYGGTKLIVEHLMYQLDDWAPDTTHISCARFGNLIGSTGSFTNIVEEWRPGDEPLKVTDPECSRFWVPIRRAVTMLDLALDEMKGGEVFVMKSPAKTIGEMIPEGARFEKVGLRPWEKTHETLVGAHEIPHTDEFASYYVVHYPPYVGRNSLKGPLRSGSSERPAQLDAVAAEVSEGSDPSWDDAS
jgi:UDP-N-acetylglucosamine 4,6-dehydratase